MHDLVLTTNGHTGLEHTRVVCVASLETNEWKEWRLDVKSVGHGRSGKGYGGTQR